MKEEQGASLKGRVWLLLGTTCGHNILINVCVCVCICISIHIIVVISVFSFLGTAGLIVFQFISLLWFKYLILLLNVNHLYLVYYKHNNVNDGGNDEDADDELADAVVKYFLLSHLLLHLQFVINKTKRSTTTMNWDWH